MAAALTNGNVVIFDATDGALRSNEGARPNS
jgi:hypothetical protein